MLLFPFLFPVLGDSIFVPKTLVWRGAAIVINDMERIKKVGVGSCSIEVLQGVRGRNVVVVAVTLYVENRLAEKRACPEVIPWHICSIAWTEAAHVVAVIGVPPQIDHIPF